MGLYEKFRTEMLEPSKMGRLMNELLIWSLIAIIAGIAGIVYFRFIAFSKFYYNTSLYLSTNGITLLGIVIGVAAGDRSNF